MMDKLFFLVIAVTYPKGRHGFGSDLSVKLLMLRFEDFGYYIEKTNKMDSIKFLIFIESWSDKILKFGKNQIVSLVFADHSTR